MKKFLLVIAGWLITGAALAQNFPGNLESDRVLGRDSPGVGQVEQLPESQFKSMFNLEPGVDVQAWDADLEALASPGTLTGEAAPASGDKFITFIDGGYKTVDVDDMPGGGGGANLTPTTPNIVSGAVTVTSFNVRPNPETGTLDEIVTINGGADGDHLLISAQTGDSLILKSGEGNLVLHGDAFLDESDTIYLYYQSPNWVEVSRSIDSFAGGDADVDNVYELARALATSALEADKPRFGGSLTVNDQAMGNYSYVIKRGDQVIETDDLGTDPFSLVAGSTQVVVTESAHGRRVGDVIDVHGATPNSVGDITVDGEYTIGAVVDVNTYTITHSSPSLATDATSGGAAVHVTRPNSEWFTDVDDNEAAFVIIVGDLTINDGWYLIPHSRKLFTTVYVTGNITTNTADFDGGNASTLSVTVDSRLVTVTHPKHGRIAGDWVAYSGAAAVGGVTITGSYEIVSVVDANTYRIRDTETATSTTTGGGTSILNHSAIAMNGRGANHGVTGSNIPAVPIKIIEGVQDVGITNLDDPQVDATCGNGGAAVTNNSGTNTTGATGQSAATGGCTGGGGGGSGGARSVANPGIDLATSGAGAEATAFSSGSGGGGVTTIDQGVETALPGVTNGGAGGQGAGHESRAGGGGAGNPGGLNADDEVSAMAGTGGTLFVIAEGLVSGDGRISAHGVPGGNIMLSDAGNASGGGSSGGGHATLLYGTLGGTNPTTGAVGGGSGPANGVDANGGGGGAGTARELSLTNAFPYDVDMATGAADSTSFITLPDAPVGGYSGNASDLVQVAASEKRLDFISPSDLMILSDASTIERSLAARFGEWKNVKDYGAVTGCSTANGGTDSTAAIKAASVSGSVIYIPPGNYCVTSVNWTDLGTQTTVVAYGAAFVGTDSNVEAIVDTLSSQGLNIYGLEIFTMDGVAPRSAFQMGRLVDAGNRFLLKNVIVSGEYSFSAFNIIPSDFSNFVNLQVDNESTRWDAYGLTMSSAGNMFTVYSPFEPFTDTNAGTRDTINARPIVGITNASPAVVDIGVAHDLDEGEEIRFRNVQGMALTGTFTADTTDNSKVLTSVSSTAGLEVGMAISGTGIPNSQLTNRIVSIDGGASTVTLLRAATANGTGVTITYTKNLNGFLKEVSGWYSSTFCAMNPTSTTFELFEDDCSTPINTTSWSAYSSLSFTGDTTNTSTTVANVNSFANLAIGRPVTGTGIPTGTAIVSLDPSNNSLELSKAATATGTTVALSVHPGLVGPINANYSEGSSSGTGFGTSQNTFTNVDFVCDSCRAAIFTPGINSASFINTYFRSQLETDDATEPNNAVIYMHNDHDNDFNFGQMLFDVSIEVSNSADHAFLFTGESTYTRFESVRGRDSTPSFPDQYFATPTGRTVDAIDFGFRFGAAGGDNLFSEGFRVVGYIPVVGSNIGADTSILQSSVLNGMLSGYNVSDYITKSGTQILAGTQFLTQSINYLPVRGDMRFYGTGSAAMGEVLYATTSAEVLTASMTATTSSGSATLTAVSDFTNLLVDQAISGAGIPSGSRILTLNPGGSSLTISANATASAAGVSMTVSSIANGARIDGFTLVTGDFVLAKNQANAAENGPYRANSNMVPTRVTWADSAAELQGIVVAVEKGSVNEDTIWASAPDVAITVGSTNIDFSVYTATRLSGFKLTLPDDRGIVDGLQNEHLWFQSVVGAVNYFEMTNSAAGGSQLLQATGDDADVTFNLASKGTDPVNLMVNGEVRTSAGVSTFELDDELELRLFEENANGSNYIGFKPPAAITSNVTCVLENDSSPIPDSCVGDGVDGGGGGAQTPWTSDIDADGFDLNDSGVHFQREQAAAEADVANQGQWWVQTGAPNLPMFTNESGTDFQLATLSGTETLTNKSIAIGQITGMGSGVATWLVTPSSANLAAAVTGETGTGAAVFGTSPGFTTAANPSSNDGAALGTTSLGWSDLHLATGALLNFANGNWVATHSSGILTVGTGELRITTPGTNTASVPTIASIVGRQTLWIPAGAMKSNVANGADCGATHGTDDSDDITIPVCKFDTTTTERADFQIGMPKNWNEGVLRYQALWTNTAGASSSVAWTLACAAVRNDDPLNATLGTAVTVVDAWIAANDLHIADESTDVTCGGTVAEGSMLAFRVTRDTANGSDAMAGDADLIGLRVYYTTNATNDN